MRARPPPPPRTIAAGEVGRTYSALATNDDSNDYVGVGGSGYGNGSRSDAGFSGNAGFAGFQDEGVDSGDSGKWMGVCAWVCSIGRGTHGVTE